MAEKMSDYASEQAVGHVQLRLREFVEDLAMTAEVIAALLPGGRPHDFESQLWDYKTKLPMRPSTSDEKDQKTYRAELGDIIKDVLAFHNTYGGFILFGIADRGANRVRGITGHFDSGESNKILQSYTDLNIECLYKSMRASAEPDAPAVGLLLVPRRADRSAPVRFRKKGPEKPSGGRCFNEETYVRIRDECRPAAATSEDWQFLHSDRRPPSAASPSRSRRPVQYYFPVRDTDLLQFVGRDEPLAALRHWLTDKRSPVRLVTGVGGFGKTTLAYRFAEEVIDTGAGDIEWVIWLSAKERTFSALLGRMVETSQVDFGDLKSVYKSILRALSYEMPLEDGDPPLEEIGDRVVDALSIYSCLIIVDDIDSLSPNDQKETVAGLNSIALRTVGREISLSRVLMTSRIDQGLPPTAIVKISGLEKGAFQQHVINLCTTFAITPFNSRFLEELFEATSGSPLFAASIVRLVKLGESPRAVVDSWRGQDGEDVREFAFEREIQRLTTTQGRLLYAVLLLGQTSISDLAGVLDVTTRVARDRISELQAYHLISTGTNKLGEASIFAPNDLIAVVGILRTHLGSNAVSVDAACARARERGGSDSRAIGAGIRVVLNAWQADRYPEAVIHAKDLRQRFPENGDVASMLGAAYLRTSPPQIEDADRELEAAHRLGCARAELLPNLILVKTERQDWQALLEITRPLSSSERGHDLPLTGFVRASKELISIAKVRGDHARIAELCIGAVGKISAAMRRRMDQTLFQSLWSARFDFAREYIKALTRSATRPGDRISIFDGVVRLAEENVVVLELLKQGLSALGDWWADVEKRPIFDATACAILSKQLKHLDRIMGQLDGYGSVGVEEMATMADISRDLAYRAAKLMG